MKTIEIAKLKFSEGLYFFNTGKFNQAENLFLEALTLSPNRISILINLAASQIKQKKFVEAKKNLEVIITNEQQNIEAYLNLGTIALELNEIYCALDYFNNAIKLDSQYAEAFFGRSNYHFKIGNYEEALNDIDQALCLKNDYYEAVFNKALILNKLNRYEEALEAYDQAILLDPNLAEPWYDKGVVLNDCKRYKEALEHYDQAISLDPNFFDAYWNKALTKLVLGNFEEGWNLYEYRWKRKELEIKPHHPFEELLSIANIKDKKILVWHEQGYGDTIQFCRYIPLLIDRGAQITFLVQPALIELFNNQFNCFITSNVDKNHHFDYQVPLLTLPKLFKTNITNIPTIPKIRANPTKQLMWREKLKFSNSKLNIGLATSGSPTQKNDHKRSMNIENIEPLLAQGTFFLFQKNLKKEDIEFLKRRPEIIYVGDQIDDFSDTAAIIENLDLVVSVCTSLIHLAGSLNKKSFLMSVWAPDWRWLQDRADTPWYPSVQIIRQKSKDDWKSVISEVCELLKIENNDK